MNSNTLASRERLLGQQTSSGLGAAREPIDPQHPPPADIRRGRARAASHTPKKKFWRSE